MIGKYGTTQSLTFYVDVWKNAIKVILLCPWFRLKFFLTITMTALHLSWKIFTLTELCTVPIYTSKTGPIGINARSSFANDSQMVSTRTTPCSRLNLYNTAASLWTTQ